MKLTKVYSDSCDICTKLGRVAEPQALDRGWSYEEVSLEEVATEDSLLKSYIVEHHLDDEGMVYVPIYLFSTDEGEVLSSGVVLDEQQIGGIMFTFDIVDTSRG